VESGATWHEIDVSPVFQLCERKYCYNARQWYGIDIVAYYFNFFSARQHMALCLARYTLSPVRQPLCPSVTRVDHTKTIEVMIMKFSPCVSP